MARSKSKLKVFHGPSNIAGIAGELSSLERAHGLDSISVVYETPGLNSNQDRSLGLPKSGLKRLFVPPFFFLKALFRYNTFHFYFGQTFLWFGLDLIVLKLFGKKVVMTYCGSEVRLMGLVDSKRNPYASIFEDEVQRQLDKKHPKWIWKLKRNLVFKYNTSFFDKRKVRMMKFHKRFVDRFIAIRDNYAYANYVIPEGRIESQILINNISVSEPKDFKHANEVPVICHAPSNPVLKGSGFIDQAVEDLKKEGLKFEYRKIQNVPFEEAKRMMQSSDVVVDQLVIGGIGSVSMEAMSYGKPVVGYLLQEVIDKHCPDLPLCNATIDTVKDVLRELIVSKELREEKGRAGLAYIHKYYNKEKMVNDMIELYSSL